MLVDLHVPLYEEPAYGENLAETAKNLGIERLCIAGGEARYGLAANAEVRRLADAYPELFVPFARIRLGEDNATTVERLYRVGFSGLCMWGPPAPYDDESFHPIYEAAQALGMPALFHTGYLPVTPLDRARRIRSANMRPVHLDGVARCFPELSIIGVGLGGPWYEEATETMGFHPNVCFDLSGEVLRRRGAGFLGELLGHAQASPWEEDAGANLWQQIVFGSGVRHEDIASVERDYQRVFRSLGVCQEDIDSVMGGTAAQLLGIPLNS
jgi:predicted TIM-barrel fold metal-dependent hydrolase